MCKLDHSVEGTIPAFLCRRCHPELIPTETETRAFYGALRKTQVIADEQRRREREIAVTRERITSMRKHGEPDPDTVAGKIYRGLCNKLARIELGETGGEL